MTDRPTRLLLTAMLAIAIGAPAWGQIIETPETKVIPKLTVRGQSELEKPADRLNLKIGVVTEHADAREAMTANSSLMNDVLKAVGRVGLKKDEYQTGRFRVRPVYERRPRGAEQDWQPRILHYEVANSIRVKTQQLDLAGEIIDAATQAGANDVGDIHFDLARPRTYRQEAITKATNNAVKDARTLAEAAGVRLVRLLSINLDQTGLRPPVARRSRGVAAASMESTPPIAAGDVTVSAGVSLVYEIAPLDTDSDSP
jgi:uncharacterized protein YggE